MPKLATNFAAAFTFATLTFAAPTLALQVGPFHLALPMFGRHHHSHHLHARAHPHHVPRYREAHHGEAVYGSAAHRQLNEVSTRELPQEEAHRPAAQAQHSKGQYAPAWPLLYPSSPLPTMFQNILWGPDPSSMWPIGYETIFSNAFAQAPTEPDQCHQPVNANAIIERIRHEIEPNADQVSRLQRLGQALDAGADRLAKSCPTEIPQEPTERLQLMLRQIEALTTAIDLIRRPLEEFEESLTQQQQKRLADAAASANVPSGREAKREIHSCGSSSAAVDRSVAQIDKSVQPNEEQRKALGELHQALNLAANDLDAHCSTPVPQSGVARLDALEARLDATWRAVLSIQVALSNFDTELSPDQKNRFNAMTFAAQD